MEENKETPIYLEIPLEDGLMHFPIVKVSNGNFVLTAIECYLQLFEALDKWIPSMTEITTKKYRKYVQHRIHEDEFDLEHRTDEDKFNLEHSEVYKTPRGTAEQINENDKNPDYLYNRNDPNSKALCSLQRNFATQSQVERDQLDDPTIYKNKPKLEGPNSNSEQIKQTFDPNSMIAMAEYEKGRSQSNKNKVSY